METSNPKECECQCGGTTKGGKFLPGHDARRKSALVNSALEGDADAIAELEHRDWSRFLDKARRSRGVTTGPPTLESVKANLKAKNAEPAHEVTVSAFVGVGDDLPRNATRPDGLDVEEFIGHVVSGRPVVIRRHVKTTYLEEVLRFKDPFHESVNVEGHARVVPCHPKHPVISDGVLHLTDAETGGRRSIRYTDVVAVLRK